MAEVKEKKIAAVDPWDQKVEIKVPKAPNGDSNFIIASVNGRTFKIQRGIKVEVPAPIAEVIEHSFEAEDAADLFIASKSDR